MSDDAYQNGSAEARNLPVPHGEDGMAQALVAYEPPASFASQLMIDPRARQKPKSPTNVALGAYGVSARSTVKRMPAGHRLTSEI